jgi:hypothetical protein
MITTETPERPVTIDDRTTRDRAAVDRTMGDRTADDRTTSPPRRPRRRRRRWPGVAMAIAGGVLLAAAPLWRTHAVPALVKFPTDVDITPRYAGTFLLFVDPATTAPLAEPATRTLAVDRRIQAIGNESSSERVVVREDIAYDIEGFAPASAVHQYVMDRRTSANVADTRAWAFEPANTLNRSGDFWVAFPKDVHASSAVEMYKDEIAGTFTATATGATAEVRGLQLYEFAAGEEIVPVTEAYLRSLDAVVPLPRSLSFEQLTPSLEAAGVPVQATLDTLLRVATPEDLATLVSLVGEPIDLEYVVSFSGSTYVEPRTGAITDVAQVVERISARPSAEALPPLLTILDRYRAEPDIAAAIAAIDRLAGEPLPVFEYRYAQTDDSVDEVAAWVDDQRGLLDLAERVVPLALTVAGGAALALAAILLFRSRRSAVT